ncbi:MAG: PhoU domain-containing protein [Gammaproteobacteria bacterium]|nr:PhoU domain-containing protein [Gammaproteobacteria bacterium]
MTNLPANIRDNLHFLIAEVDTQLDDLQRFFKSRALSRAQRVLDRRGYSENLMLRIQNNCIQEISVATERKIPRLRAIQSVSADLDRLTELSRDAINQMSYIENPRVLKSKGYVTVLETVRRGISLIEEALTENDTQLALSIGSCEHEIDTEYEKLLVNYTQALKQKSDTEDLISALLVAHTMERMGDLLLNISESLLSSILGQAMDIDRYHTLMDSLQRLSDSGENKEMVVEPIAETRSGSGISGITSKNKSKKAADYLAIYKDGLRSKLKEERDGVEEWHEVYPGLAPRILSYKKRGETASLLIEHLAGMTFEQILINESDELLNEALKKIGKTMNDVWKETKNKKSEPAGFMRQLKKRINDVYAVHPEFESSISNICGHSVCSFAELINEAEKIEEHLSPPFSVYIHGDFNVDNIIYDPSEKKVNYIDLHRSQYMDYVQDVSVFMISNYRLQIMSSPVRARIIKVIRDFYKISARYAKRNNDESFELRLALGLARSLVTSTRFILDKSLAADMYLHARYLLEQVVRLKKSDYLRYKVPVKELFIG